MLPVQVDDTGYIDAVGQLAGANRGVIEAVNALTDTLYASASMAGDDTGGSQWASAYDPAAAQLVQAGCDMGSALANMANLLNGSLANHAGADHAAMLYPGEPSAASSDTDAAHGTEELHAPAPPAADGGTGDEPSWWHWIAGHVGGLLWPDADTGRLRTAGAAWVKAGAAVGDQQYAVYEADSALYAITSPEMDDVHAACQDIAAQLSDLGRMYTAIGNACNAYAQHVDDAHHEIEDELASFIEWTIAIEAGSVILTEIGGEFWGQGIEGSRISSAAGKIIRILNRLIELARTVASAIKTAIEYLGRLLARLAKFINAKLVKALEKTGINLAKEVRGAAEAGPAMTVDDAQFGAKVGKHASDYGLNPAEPAARSWVRRHIESIRNSPDEVRQGSWNPKGGGDTDYWFYRQGSDVVVTTGRGEFVTILKDGESNGWFQEAMPR